MTGPRRSRQARGGRFYVWGPGERYWSVTTILKALPMPALKFWAAGLVAEFAYDEAANWMGMERSRAVDYLKREPFRYTGERAALGTAVHAAADAYALGKPAPQFASLEERQHVAAFLHFTKTMAPRFVATEAEVYSRRHKYAGQTDAILELPLGAVLDLDQSFPDDWREKAEARGGDLRLIVDYKTGKGVYPEAALQLNAYAGADFLGLANGTEAPLPELDGAAVLQLQPNAWKLVPVRLGPDVLKTFLFVREVFRWLEVTSKTVLGDELAATIDVESRER